MYADQSNQNSPDKPVIEFIRRGKGEQRPEADAGAVDGVRHAVVPKVPITQVSTPVGVLEHEQPLPRVRQSHGCNMYRNYALKLSTTTRGDTNYTRLVLAHHPSTVLISDKKKSSNKNSFLRLYRRAHRLQIVNQ